MEEMEVMEEMEEMMEHVMLWINIHQDVLAGKVKGFVRVPMHNLCKKIARKLALVVRINFFFHIKTLL